MISNNQKNKTSGRKRPRPDDADIVSAGDADDDEAAAIYAAIVPPVCRKVSSTQNY